MQKYAHSDFRIDIITSGNEIISHTDIFTLNNKSMQCYKSQTLFKMYRIISRNMIRKKNAATEDECNI